MRRIAVAGCALMLCGGCAVQEVRSKHKLGVEYRHSGSTSHDVQRYLVQQGFDLKWAGGVTTGVTYRRRDVNAGSGDHDDGVWFELSYPLWRAESEAKALKLRIAQLEARMGRIERQGPTREAAAE